MSSNQFVEKFIKEHGKDFPGVDPKEIKLIINAPFQCFREELKAGRLDKFKIKYFGTFTIHEKRIKAAKTRIIEKFKEGIIDKDHYEETKRAFKEYFKKMGF